MVGLGEAKAVNIDLLNVIAQFNAQKSNKKHDALIPIINSATLLCSKAFFRHDNVILNKELQKTCA